ncbi:hypothetical protein N7510_011787 [Penicillium lagena]|uniref:uncharacterized protein n=1 Tax=Penicillium lagena TaxID=94218 RepID=UPI0025423CEF|nr:uncharacterized protein N7510_011787 [Penicillium lagena]KAJ5602253.1 hypothetical protein N7510_011787 [Penicillium lagena]
MTVTGTAKFIPESIPVLVVGAGPVGLSLAIELRLRGIEVAVIDKDLEILNGHPKGRSNDLRTLEHFRRWGVSDELRKWAWQPPNPKQQLAITESLVRRPLGAFPLRYGRDVDESRDLAAEPSLSVPQPITMRVLQNRAIQLGAFIFRGWKAASVQQDDKCVMVELHSPDGGIRWVTSSYTIGCDGPGSLLRKSAGIKQKDTDPIGQNLSYVLSRSQCPGNAPRTSSIISILGEENWGYSIMVPDGQVLAEDEVLVFTRVGESYQTRQLFIAGDASHLCPPTGGYNKNVGIGDAVNLAWKLAAVLNSWGGEKSLQTYDIERRPVGERVSQSAMDLSHSLRRVAEIFKELPSLESRTSEEQRFRRAQLAYEMSYPEWNTIGFSLDQRYDTSPIIITDDWESAPYDGTRLWHYASPGHRAPHLWLTDGSPLLDHFGREFTLLDVGAVEENVENILSAARQIGIPLKRLQLPVSVARTKYPAEITIIRPDQYIGWQGSQCDDPLLMIDKIRAHDCHGLTAGV